MTTMVRYRPDNFIIRHARASDVPLIRTFIRDLADYENMLDDVVATDKLLDKWLFRENKAEVIIGEADGDAVGFALFFTSFSTFLGRPGIYLEDLFVRPKARGNGYGKQLLRYLAKLVVERGYGRLEWSCLDWNKPSIAFYLSVGAEPLDEWTAYRLSGNALEALASGEDGSDA